MNKILSYKKTKLINLLLFFLIGGMSMLSCETEKDTFEIADNRDPGNAKGSAFADYNRAGIIEFTTYKNVANYSDTRLQLELHSGNRVLELRFPKGDTGKEVNFFGRFRNLYGSYTITNTGRQQDLHILTNDTSNRILKARFSFQGQILASGSQSGISRLEDGVIDLNY